MSQPLILSASLIAILSSTSSWAAPASAPASVPAKGAAPITLEVDKGRLIVEWAAMDTPYEVTATVPASCAKTKLEFVRTEAKLEVHHVGASCRDKTVFKIRLAKNRSVHIHLGNGLIETPNLASALPGVQQIHATVDSGRVASSYNYLVPVPSHDYFSMAVNWAGGPSSGIIIDLDAKSGKIDL